MATILVESLKGSLPPPASSPSKMSQITPSTSPQKLHFNLSEFEFGRTLGTGSFGRVQLVRHLPSGQYYALKKLRKTEVIRLKQIEHTNSERKLLSCARNHPFLVQMIGTTQDAGYLYVLMEYVSGGELFSLLRKVSWNGM